MKKYLILLLISCLAADCISQECDCRSLLADAKIERTYFNESVVMHYYLNEVRSSSQINSANNASLFGVIGPIALGFNSRTNSSISDLISSRNVDFDWNRTKTFMTENYIDPTTVEQYRSCLQNNCVLSMTVDRQSDRQFIVNISYGNENIQPGKVKSILFNETASIQHPHIKNTAFGEDQIDGSYTMFVTRDSIREPIFGVLQVNTARETKAEATIYIPPVHYKPIEDHEKFDLTGVADPGTSTPISREFRTRKEIDQRLVMFLTGQPTKHNNCAHTARVVSTDLKVYKILTTGEKVEVNHWNFYKQSLCYDENRTVFLDRNSTYVVEGSINFRQWPTQHANVARLNLYLKNMIPE